MTKSNACRFLGAEYEAKLRAGLLEKVLDRSSVKKMKEDFNDFILDRNNDQIPEGLSVPNVARSHRYGATTPARIEFSNGQSNLNLNHSRVAGLRQFAAANSIASPSSPGVHGAVKIRDHVRKGTVNDWKNHLTPEQNARLESRILTEMAAEFPEIIEKWRHYGVFDPLPSCS